MRGYGVFIRVEVTNDYDEAQKIADKYKEKGFYVWVEVIKLK